MRGPRPVTVAAVAPYAAWMAMMFALPASAEWYAARSALVAALLASAAFLAGRGRIGKCGRAKSVSGILWGLLAGAAVCALWIAPEVLFPGLRTQGAAMPSPYEPSVCGWTLTVAKLAGSSFVIAPAEELFFRGFLYRWLMNDRDWTAANPRRFDLAAFLWVAALFALEHNTRIVQGLMAGVFYGWLAVRKGLVSAITAHAVTNLLLALYVILTDSWYFW